MQYLMLIYANENNRPDMTEAEQKANMDAWFKYSADMKEAGVSLGGQALEPITAATSVRLRNGETIITDGPFAETKEQLGGYYLLETPSIDEALKWAAKCPGAVYGTIEVRPIMVFG